MRSCASFDTTLPIYDLFVLGGPNSFPGLNLGELRGEDYWLALEAAGSEGEAKKMAEDIAKRVQGWEFRIAPGKAQSLLKRRADLFQAS